MLSAWAAPLKKIIVKCFGPSDEVLKATEAIMAEMHFEDVTVGRRNTGWIDEDTAALGADRQM